MSDVSSFIERWSRRKRAAAEAEDAAAKDSAAAAPAPAPPQALHEGKPVDLPLLGGGLTEPAETPPPECAPELGFDLTKLPPIESITAESDVRAFLAPGVPLELTRAALRRAWAADPKIRDFIGLSENAWDFNAPGAIPGFGPLEMTDELRRQIAQMVGRNISEVEADAGTRPSAERQEEGPAIDRTGESSADTGDVTPQGGPGIHAASRGEPEASHVAVSGGDFLQCDASHAAAQQEREQPRLSTAWGAHGGALPK